MAEPRKKRIARSKISVAGKRTKQLGAAALIAQKGGEATFQVRDRADANHWLRRLQSAAMAENVTYEDRGRVVVYKSGGRLTFVW